MISITVVSLIELQEALLDEINYLKNLGHYWHLYKSPTFIPQQGYLHFGNLVLRLDARVLLPCNPRCLPGVSQKNAKGKRGNQQTTNLTHHFFRFTFK
jgi:hypothetical protein